MISRFVRNTGGPSWKEKGTGNHVTPWFHEVREAISDTVPALVSAGPHPSSESDC